MSMPCHEALRRAQLRGVVVRQDLSHDRLEGRLLRPGARGIDARNSAGVPSSYSSPSSRRCNTPLQRTCASVPSTIWKLPAFYQKRRDRFAALLSRSRFRLTTTAGTYFQLADYGGISRPAGRRVLQRADDETRRRRDSAVAVLRGAAAGTELVRFCFAKDDATLENAATTTLKYRRSRINCNHETDRRNRRQLGIRPELEPYGPYKAKISLGALEGRPPRGSWCWSPRSRRRRRARARPRLSIGLAQGLAKIGARAAVALREPSLGPVSRHEGRRHRRRRVAGGAVRRHQPALHRRHPRRLERAQPARRDASTTTCTTATPLGLDSRRVLGGACST